MTKFAWSLGVLAILLLTAPLPTLAAPDQPVAQTESCAQLDTKTRVCRRILGEGANWWKGGRKTFFSHCKSCHSRDNDAGAPFLHIESKTQDGWDRVFLTRYPECAKNGAWESLSAKELQDLNDFLYRYAYGTGGIYESRFG